ncbi:pilus assembly protein [Angustibacter sp. McL0619]|uniref:pilus assembly protein n=1 Tax=Angustibacter sp. McL0619 TaxID=3415676 RepID=UPI003CFAED2F
MSGTRSVDDQGSAVVEFIVLGLLLLLPVVYLVLVLARIEGAAFAVQRAAREAGRAYVTADRPDHARERADAAAALALSDQRFEGQGALVVSCSQPDCLAPDSRVTTSARVRVALPGVPRLLDQMVPAAVEVVATQVTPVDRFATRPDRFATRPGRFATRRDRVDR